MLTRPKQGFHLPVAEWISGGLRPQVEELLSGTGGPAFDYVRHDVCSTLLAEHLARRADRSTELWFLLSLDGFLRAADRSAAG